MQCPKCESPELAAATVRGIEVDRCPQCHGIWFDPKELATLMASSVADLEPLADGKANPAANARTGLCPRDRTRLIRVLSARRRTVTLETCPKCHGLWLDGGELAQLLHG